MFSLSPSLPTGKSSSKTLLLYFLQGVSFFEIHDKMLRDLFINFPFQRCCKTSRDYFTHLAFIAVYNLTVD